MNSQKYIKEKQKFWAESNGIRLIGSKIERGEKIYTTNRDENFFCNLSKDTIKEFKSADGNEFGKDKNPGKIQALHSSSAIAVNVFEYWKNKDFEIIARSLGIPSKNIVNIIFEKKLPISNDFAKPPNIDVVFEYSNSYVSAIECKFTEAYGQRIHQGLKEKYLLESGIWDGIPETRKLSEKICPQDNKFKYLHSAQLVKHMLGLLSHSNGRKNKFRLVYLWYDVFGEDGYFHKSEIEMIKNIFQKDNLNFQSITYQELIMRLLENKREEDSEYIKYLAERYL